MIRCYNCGEVGHRTQHCTQYGPYYMEPGKTAQDYSELVQRIADLFAQDIITEHEAGHRGSTPESGEEDAGHTADPGREGVPDRSEEASVGP